MLYETVCSSSIAQLSAFTPAELRNLILRCAIGVPVQLGGCCRGLRAACEDGELWRSVLGRCYPGHRLVASSLTDWKHAFLLQARGPAERSPCLDCILHPYAGRPQLLQRQTSAQSLS